MPLALAPVLKKAAQSQTVSIATTDRHDMGFGSIRQSYSE
jgi:hypothetical protein